MIFPGRTEFAEKYGRVAGRLVDRGFSVAVDRLARPGPLRPAGRRTRCAATSTISASTSATSPRCSTSSTGLGLPGPRLMVAHSMGGAIGLRTLLERADFGAAIFSAPMWHLQMRAATRELTARFTQLAYMMGFGDAADARHPREADRPRRRLRGQRADHRPRHLRLVRRPDRHPPRAGARRPVDAVDPGGARGDGAALHRAAAEPAGPGAPRQRGDAWSRRA